MRSVRVHGATNLYGAPANWDEEKYGKCGGLPVRREFWPEGSTAQNALIQCTSAWKPSAAELALLNSGGAIEVRLIMPVQCPMLCVVVPNPEDEVVEVPDRAPTTTINEDGHGMGYDEHGPATP